MNNTALKSNLKSKPHPLRPLSILQLCIAFSLVAWICAQPFMGELLTIKTKLLLLEEVMGIQKDSSEDISQKEKKMRNGMRFATLSSGQQAAIIDLHNKIQQASRASFLIKFKRMMTILFFEISPFTLMWIAFGIAIPILVLLHQEGARRAAWLLFFLTVFYAVDNRINGSPVPHFEDRDLFPSELYIIKNYFDSPLSEDILTQYAQFTAGWKSYLVNEWTSELPLSDSMQFEKQVEQGEHAFNLARAEKISPNLYPSGSFRRKESIFFLALYLLWNFYFAVKLGRVVNS